MKKIVLFCIIISTFSCISNINNSSFSNIDYSTNNGDRGIFSLKIDSRNNNVFIKGEDIFEGKYMLATKLSYEVIDSLNKIISKINFTLINTSYAATNCQDCGYYNLIVKKDGEEFRTNVDSPFYNFQELKEINELSAFLNYIHNSLFEQAKNIVFDSNPKDIYLPPLPL